MGKVILSAVSLNISNDLCEFSSNYIFLSSVNKFVTAGNRNQFEIWSDHEAVRILMDMPGVDNDGLDIWYENDRLEIKGFGPVVKQGKNKNDAGSKADSSKEEREYWGRVEFGDNGTDSLMVEKANFEMKNGVLSLTIPRLPKRKQSEKIKVTLQRNIHPDESV